MEEIFSVVKEELYAIELDDNCLLPFLCGAIRGGGEISMIYTGYELSFLSGDEAFIRLLSDVIFRLEGEKPSKDTTVIDGSVKHILYVDNKLTNDLLEKCLIVKNRYTIVEGIPDGFFGRDDVMRNDVSQMSEEKRVFLRGLFLSCGFLRVPDDIEQWNQEKTKSGYKLSLNLNSEIIRDDVVRLIVEEADVEPSVVLFRKKRNGIYLKNSQAICNFLVAIGSNIGVLRLYEVITNRKMKNDMNRLQNFDMANIDKTAVSAAHQIAAIKQIDKIIGIKNLPDGLRKVCEFRLENEEAGLEKIAKMFDPPVTKSCVNHRMRKIMAIAAGKCDVK